jgi:hypothetical protein
VKRATPHRRCVGSPKRVGPSRIALGRHHHLGVKCVRVVEASPRPHRDVRGRADLRARQPAIRHRTLAQGLAGDRGRCLAPAPPSTLALLDERDRLPELGRRRNAPLRAGWGQPPMTTRSKERALTSA